MRLAYSSSRPVDRLSAFRSLLTRAAAASGVLAAALAPMSTLAQEAHTTPVLKAEPVGESGTEPNIVEFEVEPGWETQRHIHPGHVFVHETEGTIEVDVDGQPLRTVSAGEAFYDLPNKPMVARTASSDKGARFTVCSVECRRFRRHDAAAVFCHAFGAPNIGACR